MSTPDPEEKARNSAIAQNEAHRETVSSVRVSAWAVAVAVIIGAIVVGIVWASTHRYLFDSPWVTDSPCEGSLSPCGRGRGEG